MNQYETVFILTPVLSDEQMKETAAKFKKLLTDNGAEILECTEILVIGVSTIKFHLSLQGNTIGQAALQTLIN